ncbi:methyltransferase domain-containing protein [Xylariales sp. PMI_506]|nr:methyltransferase domain-containing protein [Xylariales sp. PMI_506]
MDDTGDKAASDDFTRFALSLKVDDGNDEEESGLDRTDRPDSASTASSVFEFVEENGRTYHKYKEGKYWMPNDAEEQSRLDLQHAIFMRLFDKKLSLAPIDRPEKVLDLGTGTGIWAMEFAAQYPESDVLGVDVSPIQPPFVPENCHFEVDDIEDEWVYPHKFDYIHARHMVGSVQEFPKLLGQAYEHLVPGGTLELQDYFVKLGSADGSLEGTALQRWNLMLLDGVSRAGRSGLGAARYKGWMEAAGFADVQERRFVVPGNAWAKGRGNKTLGTWQMQNILDGLHGISIMLFTRLLGMAVDEVEALLEEVRRDLRNTDIHFYYPVIVVYGKKPEV